MPKIPQEKEVQEEIDKILKIENATQRAIRYMLYGMRSQLFWDGNKRTSTICANKIMIENGVGIIKVPDNKLEEFNILLTEFYNTNNSDKIEQFIFDNCIDGISF
jgi:prophage maintenance system killer protein